MITDAEHKAEYRQRDEAYLPDTARERPVEAKDDSK